MVSFLIGYTTLSTHRVNTQDHTHFEQAADSAQEGVKNILEMLDLGVREPSKSHWDLLVALVPKEDVTTVGSMTGLLPMPIPCPKEELHKWIAHGHFLTTDLCKGTGRSPGSRRSSKVGIHHPVRPVPIPYHTVRDEKRSGYFPEDGGQAAGWAAGLLLQLRR